VLLEGIDAYDLDKEGKKIIYKAGPVYGVIEAAPAKKSAKANSIWAVCKSRSIRAKSGSNFP